MWQITYQRPNGALWMFSTEATELKVALGQAWDHIYRSVGDQDIYDRLQVMVIINPPEYRLRDTENEAIRP